MLADAAHNLTDDAGLLIAWGAAVLAKRAMTARHTWGLGRGADHPCGIAQRHCHSGGRGCCDMGEVHRLSDPVSVPGLTVMQVALVGIAVNTGSTLLFMSARKGDLNARRTFLHIAAGAAV